MDCKKISFIMCTNNERYRDEAKLYIDGLEVPEGYEAELICITDANSMTSGYNYAMHSTDSKYKVYLHQDVFIINKRFIHDMLNIFKDESIGMLGMVGAPKLHSDCIMWNGDRIGMIVSSNPYHAQISDWGGMSENGVAVEAVDGLLMATQYDVEWREDIFTGWDFYDVSQSFEFRRQGYKVVVPLVTNPWVVHDDGFLNLRQYYKYRRVFMEEYKDMLY